MSKQMWKQTKWNSKPYSHPKQIKWETFRLNEVGRMDLAVTGVKSHFKLVLPDKEG
jgi:hypothetical protein